MAERDRKGSYEADQQQQQQQQQPPPLRLQQQGAPADVSQQAAELVLAIFQQVQRQMRNGTLNLTGEIDEEQLKRAAFAGAAYSTIVNGLELLPALNVDRVAPSSGSKTGGFPVTIGGNNFLPGATVSLQSGDNRTALTNVVVVSDAEIQGTIPASSTTGAVDVIVSTSLGEERKLSGFTYT